jgi:hypothetical protein
VEKYIHYSLCRQSMYWDYFTSTSTYRTNNTVAMLTCLILNLDGIIKAIGRLLCMYKSSVLLTYIRTYLPTYLLHGAESFLRS